MRHDTVESLAERPLRSLGPGCGTQLAEFAHIGPVQALGAQPVPNETRLVRDPLLVDVEYILREEAVVVALLAETVEQFPKGDLVLSPYRPHNVLVFNLGDFEPIADNPAPRAIGDLNWQAFNELLNARICLLVDVDGLDFVGPSQPQSPP